MQLSGKGRKKYTPSIIDPQIDTAAAIIILVF